MTYYDLPEKNLLAIKTLKELKAQVTNRSVLKMN